MKNNSEPDSIMKRIVQFIIVCIAAMTVSAQEKKAFTLDDVIPGGSNYYNLTPKNLPGLKWWGDVCMKADVEDIRSLQPSNGKEQVILTLEEVNGLLEAQQLGKLHHLFNVSFPYVGKQALVSTPTHRVLVDWEKKEVVWNQPIAPKAASQDWNKESRSLAYTIENNLFVTTADGQTRQVTHEPKGIVCGQSVHRQEFGIYKGTFWSPKGNLLAFYRMDETQVTDYPQVNTSTRIATLENDKYPMAGMTSHKVTVGVYAPATGKTVFLDAGDPTDRYFTNISWSPDERSVYVIELNRDQNHARLVRYNAATGAQEATLYEEKHAKYVEPQHPLTFLPWDDTKFIYQSQRDGYNHLYLFDTQAQVPAARWQTSAQCPESSFIEHVQVSALTQGDWLVQQVIGFCPARKELLIGSTEGSPLQTNIYRLNGATQQRVQIGAEDGTHQVQLSSSGTYLIDNFTSFNVPRSISLLPTNGKKGRVIFTATDPLQEQYNLPEITLGTLKAADGKTDLYYRLIKPVDFDPAQKYPAVIYVYGGPHAQLIHNKRFYDARGWDLYMAQQGYVMLTVDSRGSDNRGLAFENCTFRHLGEEEMKDQVKGVELLKSLPYVDGDRIGVHGWSFGGFMTTNLMLSYPDVFKVGVAGGPVIDWAYYEVMYGERYMDTPQSNPEGYDGSNLKRKAGQLKGRLEIIIGGEDPTCVPQHSYAFLRACIDAGTHPDFFVYPEGGHNMVGTDRVHLHEHITRYFEDHLK